MRFLKKVHLSLNLVVILAMPWESRFFSKNLFIVRIEVKVYRRVIFVLLNDVRLQEVVVFCGLVSVNGVGFVNN